MADTARPRGRVGRWALAAGIPTVGVGVWWPSVSAHPVLAGTLVAGYFGLLVASRFGADVAGELRARWRDRIVDGLDRMLLRWLSRCGRHYRAALLASLRFVDLKGLSVVGFHTPELDEVFVDVSLEHRAPSQVPTGLLPDERGEPIDRLWLGNLVNQRHPVILAVVGVPGSGKTTLVRHTTRRLCHSRRGPRPVPALLYLRDHAATIVAEPLVSLPDLVRQQIRYYGVEEPPDWFERQLRKGRCVVQLDGLDEVARQDDRRIVASWVERQIARYPDNDFVITSRPHGYRTAPVGGTTVLRTRSFTDEQFSTFVRAWYRAVERQVPPTGAARTRANARSADLLDRLKRSPELYELTVNPLLLTMIANVHRELGALPGSRAGLYQEICQVVLGRRRAAHNLSEPLDADAKEAVLRRLALIMMRKQTSDLLKQDVLAELRAPLCQLGGDLTAAGFLAEVVANGMLIERELDTYSFAHLTLQEYLAAKHIRVEQLGDMLTQTVDDTWWRETTLLYAAHSPVDPIVSACLDSGSTVALTLAFDCAEQATELPLDLSRRLDTMLDEAFAADTDQQRRRMLAGVLVSRELRQRIRIGDTAAVCRQPISNRIYSLFADETPAHEGSEATQPVHDMRGPDVVRFVEWVNQVTSDGPTYRLPRREEVTQRAVQENMDESGINCIWLDSGKPDRPEPWPDPHHISASYVLEQVDDDFARSPETVVRLILLHAIISISYCDRARAETLLRALSRGSRGAAEIALGLDRDMQPHLAQGYMAGRGNLDWLSRYIHEVFALCPSRKLTAPLETAVDLSSRLNKELYRAWKEAPSSVHKGSLNKGLSKKKLASGLSVDLAPVTGRALSAAADRLLDPPTSIRGALSRFVKLFKNEIGEMTKLELITDEAGPTSVYLEYYVSPDSLAGRIHESCAAIVNLRKPQTDSWLHHVTGGLQRIGREVLATQKQLTTTDATTARLTALCLAGETNAGELQRAFHEIAAGITLVQLRQQRKIPPARDTLILAVG